MTELFRFQQLRPPQTISDEQKAQTGIPLYPGNNTDLSAFAQELTAFVDNTERYDTVIRQYLEANNKKNLITDLKQVDPAIAQLYKWFDFKSRPVKLKEFADTAGKLKADGGIDLDKEQKNLADNFLLAIYQNQLSTNFCLDYQLLLKVIYILRMCLKQEGNNSNYIVQGTEALLNALLDLPIIIPPAVLRSRCIQGCAKKQGLAFPIGEKGSPAAQPAGPQVSCNCSCDQGCKNPSKHCICIRTYVGDLFIVKQELARYEAGDIADIENILAGEKKVRRHKTMLRTETTSEQDTETDTFQERDNQVSEKASLQSEVKSTIDTKLGFDAGVTASLKYGEAITITPHANVTGNFSKTTAENTAKAYSKEIVDRSVSKIEEKVRTVKITNVINLVQEKNEHSIDNAVTNASHRSGIYYWVNKVSHGQVFNYGRHMMFDLIIPEPAAIFKKLYQQKIKNDQEGNEPEKPVLPETPMPSNPQPLTPALITRLNYGDILNRYAIATSSDEIHPPADTLAVQIAFSQNVPKPDGGNDAAFSSNEFKVDIPAGYRAATMDYDVRVSTGDPGSTGPDDEVAVSVNVGSTCIFNNSFNEFGGRGSQHNRNWFYANSSNMNGEVGTITLAVAGFSSLSLELTGSVSIKCQLTDDAYEKWKAKIYNLVMGDYNTKLAAYKAGDNKNDQLIQIKGRNPFLNREIERNEFKRNIIAILMCNYFNGIGSVMERVSPCGYPEIDFGKLEKDAPIIQFFEQVFEWEYLNYLFYHSMWARKCKWVDLISEDSGDPLFDKFLMAGASRVQVPIRPGMEQVFNWFLRTGQVWGASGIPPMPGDSDYLSMIQELKEANQCDYSDRPGLIEAKKGKDMLKLTGSLFYWDNMNDLPNQLNLDNDIDREILVNFKIYRIVKVEEDTAAAADHTAWQITIERPYEDADAKSLKHGVGALFVGAPWEIVVPTELVYLRNDKDKLPVYPLS